MVYTAVVQLTGLFLRNLQSDALRDALLEAALYGAPTLPRRDDESEEEDGPESRLPPPWTRSVGKREGGPSYSGSEEDETRHSAPIRPYSPQACLPGPKGGLGLRRRSP
ncbi:hypothetical protein PG997_014707 [Apiospora hydei]|uniref:Uncharacterized protein n=1 Tax=Apiospora hydei TaxID=1337664 RepID=A0ABR1UUK3_9PEZI